MTRSATLARRLPDISLIALLLNVVGICIYLRLASHGWRIAEEHGGVPVSGEPFVWALALPAAMFCALLNSAWLWLFLRYREALSIRLWVAACALWVVAVVIDFAHH